MDIIGIDLGTTNSVATVYSKEELKHISFEGSYLLPSVVNISNEGVIVGKVAKNLAMIAPHNTAISIKRKMGSDEKVILNNKEYLPEEISALILKKIAQTANEEMGIEYKRCVITVPAYFNEKQREATARAAKIAGLDVIRIINEPTAAAISYGANKQEDMLYAVYDLGGGTFDVSIMENSEGLIEVVSTAGDNYLGGDDFDKKLADLIFQKSGFKIERNTKLDIKLLQLAEKIKIELSDKEEIEINEKFFAKDKNAKPLHLEIKISRDEFIDLIKANIDKTIELLYQATQEAGYEIEDIDVVILTGGSSKIPFIAERILEKTSKLPVLIEDPDKSVSIGAILQGAMIEGKNIDSIFVDITPYALGTSSLDELGDVEISNIIFKNTPVPVSKTQRFYAIREYQDEFGIDVYQGEGSQDVEKNVFVGEMILKIKEPAKDGEIDITFSLDQNGILEVTGVEVNTKEQIKGEFTTLLSKTSVHNNIVETKILDEHEKSIVFKIDELLNKEDILEEDKKDLKALRQKYINAPKEEKGEIEEEIIDTIFFLES